MNKTYEWESRVWALYMHLLEGKPVPSLFAEYQERGFNWPKQLQTEPWEIEPPTYWGYSE